MDDTSDVPINTTYFHVFKRGKLSVVGFDGKLVSSVFNISECCDALLGLADNPECELLVVDLMDIEIISSWLLGVLAAVQQRGVEVHLYHPSPEIRGVLDITRFDELMIVRKGFEVCAEGDGGTERVSVGN